MLRIGIVGFGFMGRMHYNCWKNLEGAEVRAVCDSDPDIIAKTNESVGNIADADKGPQLKYNRTFTSAHLSNIIVEMLFG